MVRRLFHVLYAITGLFAASGFIAGYTGDGLFVALLSLCPIALVFAAHYIVGLDR